MKMNFSKKNWIITFIGGVLTLIAIFIPFNMAQASLVGLASARGYYLLLGLVYISLKIFSIITIKNSFYLFEEIDIYPSLIFPVIIEYIIALIALLIIILGIKQKNNSKSLSLSTSGIIFGTVLIILSIVEYILIQGILDIYINDIFGMVNYFITLKILPNVGFYFLLFSGVTLVISSIYSIFLIRK
jgi:hypothetical protein